MEIRGIINALSLQQIGQSFAFVDYVGDELVDVLIGCVAGIGFEVSRPILLHGWLGFYDEFGVGGVWLGVGGLDALQDVHNGLFYN